MADKKPSFSLKKPTAPKPAGTAGNLKIPKISLKPLPPRPSLRSTPFPRPTLSPLPKAASTRQADKTRAIKTGSADSGNNLSNKFLSRKPVKTKETEAAAEAPQNPVEERNPEQPVSKPDNNEQNPPPGTGQPLSGYLKGRFLDVVEELNHIRQSMNSLESKLSDIESDGFKEEQSLLLTDSWPQKDSAKPEKTGSWFSGILSADSSRRPAEQGKENWEKPVRPSKENPTWKDTIVNLKVMASSESSRQYSKRKAFGKDSGLAPEIDTLTRLPAHPAPDFSGKKQNSFTVVQDQLRKIHNLINTHEEPESEIMLPDGEETLYCPNDSVSSEEKTPESGRKYEESLEDSERLLYNHFLKDLFSSQEEVQIAAAKSLAGFPSARTGLALMEAWQKTASSRTRSEIAKTLSSLKEEGAVILFRKYLAHEELSYQMSALEGLYRMGTEAAMGGVITALRSGDHQLRRRAVTYIGWLKVPTALQELGPLLKDPNEFVRKVTLSVVSNLETPNKLPFLIETLHDSSLEIRRAAFKSLQAISGKKLAFDPRASETKRVAAIKKLKEKLT